MVALVLLIFGIVGQLNPEVWTACMAFMDALQHTNYTAMAEIC